MRFNILVTGALYSSQSAYSALQFCEAAITAGHSVSQVFFYQDGATIASALSVPVADEFHAVDAWVEYAERTSTDLVVCVSAAERRGILGSEQAIEFDKATHNLHASFKVEGLGALHEASLASDRTVSFK